VKDRQYHSVELEKYATENSELREELRVLNEDLLAYGEAVAELKGDLEDAAEDKITQDAALREAVQQIAALRSELDEANAAIQRSSQ
jgi:chromosome segregation ATPase